MVEIEDVLVDDTYKYLSRNRYRFVKGSKTIGKMKSVLQGMRVVLPMEVLGKPEFAVLTPKAAEVKELAVLGSKKALIKGFDDIRDMLGEMGDENEKLILRFEGLPFIRKKYEEVVG